MNGLIQDLRYAARQLLKAPAFTIVAALTLALGIGANTAVFSVVNGLLLRNPPISDPSGVVVISGVNPSKDVEAPERSLVSPTEFLEWSKQSASFTAMTAAEFGEFTLSGGDSAAQRVPGARVSASFFNVFKVSPPLGRPIRSDENEAGENRVVVLSDELWQSRFGADPHVIGTTSKINGSLYTIIGVMPRGFRLSGEFRAQLWTPLPLMAHNSSGSGPDARSLRVFARLRPGVDVRRADSEMKTIAERVAHTGTATNSGWSASVVSLHQFNVADSDSEAASAFLSAVVGFVLLIGCTNLANIMLARNFARQNEFAIRSALGAGNTRVIRLVLTESVILSSIGGALGLLLAVWGVRVLRSGFDWNENAIATAHEIRVDSHVLIFTVAVSLATTIFFGLVPAIQIAFRSGLTNLNERRRGSTAGPTQHRQQRLLVIGQLAVSLFLLVGAGLFVSSIWHQVRASVGLNSHNLLTAAIPLQGSNYMQSDHQWQFVEQVQQRVSAVPGVESVALTTDLPFNFPGDVRFTIAGQQPARPDEKPTSAYFAVSPGYFSTTQIPLLRGREFSLSDGTTSRSVVIINEAFASRFFEGRDPIGLRVNLEGRKNEGEIVGVVANVREFLSQTEPRPEVFVPIEQEPSSLVRLVVRTRSDPATMSDFVRRAVSDVDQDQAVTELRTMDRVIADSGSGSDLIGKMMTGFATLALAMAAIGLYGVLSYIVNQRTHELGIRLALGSTHDQIVTLVLRNGMLLVGIGTVIGSLASLVLPRLVTTVFQLPETNMRSGGWVLVAGPCVLLLTGFVACCLPAWRAAKVHPMDALRCE